MEFIYLMQGNWFELKNINQEKTVPFDIEMLKEEILNQVNNRSDNLSFIDITFGSRYSHKSIESIDFYLDKEKFNLIASMLKLESRHPVITFHGTSLKSVKSILEQGYIVPQLDKNNPTVRATHGAAYGIGVYSSPFFDKAMYYTTPDNAHVYILINIVFLGKAKLIPPGGISTNFSTPANGVYADGSNTRIVYGLEQVITADAARVVPVAVMKISIS